MRPVWERALTWGVADHLRRTGVSDEAAYSAAALVVRDLDRRYGLSGIMAGSGLTAVDVLDGEQTPPAWNAAVQAFWAAVASPSIWRERNALLALATASMKRGGVVELSIARQLAREAKTVETDRGRLGQDWKGLGGGLHRRALLPAAFVLDGLRDDVVAVAADKVAAAVQYDFLWDDTVLLATLVRAYQQWGAESARRWYTGAIDGVWGPKTEALWARTNPGTTDKPTSMPMVEAVFTALTRSGKSVQLAQAIGIGMARDQWLVKRGVMASPVPTPAEDEQALQEEEAREASAEGSGLVVTVPTKPPAGGGLVVTVPDKPPPLVDVRPAPQAAGWRPSRGQLVAGGLVLLGGGLIAVAVKMSKPKRRVPAWLPARARRH